MPFTVYDGLIKPLQLDGFGTFGIEVVLFAFMPLCLATGMTVQSVIYFVIGSLVPGVAASSPSGGMGEQKGIPCSFHRGGIPGGEDVGSLTDQQ